MILVSDGEMAFSEFSLNLCRYCCHDVILSVFFLLTKGCISPITNGFWKNKCPNNVLLYDGDNYRSISDAAKGVQVGYA